MFNLEILNPEKPKENFQKVILTLFYDRVKFGSCLLGKKNDEIYLIRYNSGNLSIKKIQEMIDETKLITKFNFISLRNHHFTKLLNLENISPFYKIYDINQLYPMAIALLNDGQVLFPTNNLEDFIHELQNYDETEPSPLIDSFLIGLEDITNKCSPTKIYFYSHNTTTYRHLIDRSNYQTYPIFLNL